MENEDIFNYKNPVIDNAKDIVKKECLCQRCFNSFWLEENKGDRLQCICQIMNTKTYFSIENIYHNEKDILIDKKRKESFVKLIFSRNQNIIVKCKGREHDFSDIFVRLFDEQKRKCACTNCKYSFWFQYKSKVVKCYCRALNLIVFNTKDNDKYIKNCNGVEPAKAMFDE